MSSNPLRTLNAAGQSVWYDNIQRAMLVRSNGQPSVLERMIAEDDLRGITSNPAIFEKAIGSGHDYDAALAAARDLAPEADARALFFTLAVADIREAADQIRPVYDATGGVDGMISLEVSPDLAHDTDATVAEARELHARVDRPNVMIKVPATKAGLPAITQLIADGIHVNVTLLFSVERYKAVVEAYIQGLEQRTAKGLPASGIQSVASFFVSRVDSALDPILAEKAPALSGKAAIANAKLAYDHFLEVFKGERFAALAAADAAPQRLLWASTGTKNPAYSDVLYIETLIGPETVNTVPPATYAAFKDHGQVAQTLHVDLDGARELIDALADLGVDLAAVTDTLEAEGVASFAKSFDALLATLDEKLATLAA